MDQIRTEQPAEPNPILGMLEDNEKASLSSLRRSANDVINEIGQLEVRKARLLGSLQDIEHRAQRVLDMIANRLQIAPGTPWQVSPDGSARQIEMPQAGSAS